MATISASTAFEYSWFTIAVTGVGGVIAVIVVVLIQKRSGGEHSYMFDCDCCQSEAYGRAVWDGTWANLCMQNVESPSISTNVSTTASAPVPTVQSPAQPSSSLPSGQQPSMYQTPPAQQQQNPQMATPSQVQQPLGMCRVSTSLETLTWECLGII